MVEREGFFTDIVKQLELFASLLEPYPREIKATAIFMFILSIINPYLYTENEKNLFHKNLNELYFKLIKQTPLTSPDYPQVTQAFNLLLSNFDRNLILRQRVILSGALFATVSPSDLSENIFENISNICPKIENIIATLKTML